MTPGARLLANLTVFAVAVLFFGASGRVSAEEPHLGITGPENAASPGTLSIEYQGVPTPIGRVESSRTMHFFASRSARTDPRRVGRKRKNDSVAVRAIQRSGSTGVGSPQDSRQVV
jgi:hypothetical protein